MENKPQGKVVVNITKKKKTTINKEGQVISQVDAMGDKEAMKEARAKKLGFK